MGFKNHINIILFILMLLFISGCSSVRGLKRNTDEAIMYGMVYDEENIPVSNAEVIVDGRRAGMTDAQGRFILVSKRRNEFTLSLIKTGYEDVTGVFYFEPMDVIHLVMVNADQLINRAEFAMTDGQYREVVIFCDRALVLNPARIDASYLKALSLVWLREYDLAREILEELHARIGERDYIRRVLDGLPNE